MLRYAARRLLTLPVTLLFIALAGFALVQLLPGDPVLARTDLAAARGLPAAEVARLRSLYGLDLPAFVNTDVLDRGRRVRRLIEKGDVAALRTLGTLALPELVEALDRPDLLALCRDLLGLGGAAGPQQVRAAHERARQEIALRVEALVAAPSAERESAVVAMGTAAVRPVAMALLAGRGEAASLSRVLSALTDFRGTPDGFVSWWRRNRLTHIDLSPFERAVAALTETRLGRWLGSLVRLDFGDSHDGRPVSRLVAEALPVTALLGLAALLVAYALAIPLGAFAAMRRGGLVDRATVVLTLVGLALPAPWVAVALISLFADVLPVQGLESPAALVLPVACLAYGTAALLARYGRAAMLAALAEPFVQAARAKGLGEGAVVFRHALRASVGPAISLLSVELPWLLSGSVVVETAFDVPGMGLLCWRALAARDYPTLLGAVVVLAMVAAIASLVTDLLAARADPRIALDRRGS